MNIGHFSRRELLKCGFASALSASSLRGALGLLAGAGASAARAQTDYKALVCIYLFGGNDGYNVLVPNDPEGYSRYAQARGNLAVPQAQLLPITPTSGGLYGLHPSCAGLRDLFRSGRLAFAANLGTLLQPTTKADYTAGRNLPPQLFSHNDQQDQSMSSAPDAIRRVGWGGRLAERLADFNQNRALSLSISIAGNNRFQAGAASVPYVLNAGGVQTLRVFTGGGAAPRRRREALAAIQAAAQAPGAHRFERHGGALAARSIALADELVAALAQAPTLNTTFPANNRLADQLRMAAQLISVRQQLQVARQVFFVSLGGFDTHDDQLLDHPGLLTQISEALAAFDAATTELGVASQVTSFTMSDFGRTLTTNGDGSDHAWGNIAWVSGGAVRGGAIYGRFPDLTLDGPDDARGGRLIPTTGIEQYGATLSRWFGASESDLDAVFPHLTRFPSRDLGFL